SLLVGRRGARVPVAAGTRNYLGPGGVVIAARLVGLVILDTTLVTFSRSRAGRPVLAGGRDHVTQRLACWLGAPRKVAMTLALTQLVVCGITIGVAQAGLGWVLLAGAAGLLLGGLLIWAFERATAFHVRVAPVSSSVSA